MWQLLYYAAVSLVAASSAGLLATYIAVTRFAVVGRCITFALHRGLRGVSETQPEQEHAPAFKVTRTARGVRVEDLRLAQDLLERSSQLGCMLSRVAVRLVEVQFATLSEPMRVHMDGLDIELLQRRLPEYMGPEELAQRQQAQDGAIKAAKLAAIDKLLWSTNFAQPHASPTAEHMGGGSRTARFAVHRLLAICIQFLEVQASNVSVTCTQAGQPGPQPTPGSALDGKDSVVLALRKLVLEPQSEVSELDYDQAAEGAQPTQGTAAQILAWMGCLKLPSAIWRQLTLNRPRSMRLQVAGSEHGHLNGSILHHDALQRPAGLPMHRTNSEDSFAESVESAQQCKHQHRHRHPADEDEAVNASGSSCCMLDVEVQLRALVPTWDAASVVTAIRMLDRLQTYQQYAPYWQSRPQIAVSVNPGAWWCHAGLATAQVCRQISRQQVCLHSMDKRRRARLRYQRAYAARCASLPTWQDDRAWWQLRKRMAPADAHDHATLEQLEASLSVEQIAHFRAGVAALHSKPLLRNEAVFRHAMDALDAMIAATGPLPPAIEALIFQQDMCSSQNRLFGLVMSVSCPKVGIILDVGEVWTATTPRMPSSQFASLEAAVRGVTCKMTAESKVVVNIASIGGGGMCLRDGQMTAEVLSSPSAECNRLLRVADLQAVATREDTFYSSKHAGLDFLYMRISLHSGYQQDKPLRGRHVATAESAVQATEEWHALQPAGMDVSLRLAGIKVAYKTDVVAAALAFVGQLHRLQGLRLKPAPQSAPPVPPPPPPDPSQPANLAERVLHAFAQQDIAIHSPLALPHLTLKLTCPGVVLQIPYKHVNWEAKPCGRPDPQSSHAGAPAPPDEPEYELIAAVTVISARVFGEDFQHFMHSGATQRFSIGASLDLFCYQQPHNRVRAGAGPTTMARLASLKRARSPGGEKPLELPALRQATAQEAAANSIDDDAEMMAMARVWAHPEDLPLFPGGDNEVGRSYSDAFEHASLRPDLPKVAVQPGSMTSGGLLGSLPPFPLIPLAKVALSQTEVSRKVHSLPAAPGSTILNAALGVVGIHFWVSPWQVAHVLSILRAVKDVAPNTLLTSPPEQPAAPVPSGQGTSALKTQLRFSLSMEIPLITALCLVAQPHAAAPDSLRLRKGKAAWGNHRLAHEELAAGWSRSLAHVYGINLVGLRAAANYKGTGEIKAGLNLDGFLTRDLQLSANAPNAYFARPLPQRSLVLTEYACDFRRRLLRVATPHKAVKRWLKAVRLIYLRRRSSQSWVYGVAHRLDASATAAVPFASPFSSSVTGPQLSLNFLMRAPNKYPGHPHHRPAPPADLKVEVGQMLLYARVSMRNRMLPLTTQMMSLVTAYLRTSAASSPAGEPTPVSPPPAACQTSDLPVPQAHFPGLKVHAGCVGVDLVMLVDGRELVSLKLLDAVVLTDTQPVQTGSQDAALSVGVTIQDICIRDLQAQPGHQLVLRPNGDSRYCSLALEFIKPASLHGKPSLIVEMDNPRVLALFRFVYDILHAVTIIQGALAPAAVGAGRLRTSGGLEERSSPSQTSANVSMPLDVTVHLTNASAVLPASSRSRQAAFEGSQQQPQPEQLDITKSRTSTAKETAKKVYKKAQHAPQGSRQRSPQDASSHAEAFLAVLLQDVSFYRAKLAPLAHCSPGNFCPISVHSYAWPLARFDVVERGCFVHHSSYALIMHHSEEAAEEPYMHLHLTTSPISTVLNVANYAALLSFTSGNLVEVSSFTAARPAASPHPPTRSKFDPSFKFGVPAGDVPTFRMTLNIPQATSVFEADAALWQSDAFKHSLATSHTSLPFLKCVLTTVQMDLAVLRHSKSTHISITSSAVAADDLRLAYSHMLSEIENVPEHPAQALPRQLRRQHSQSASQGTAAPRRPSMPGDTSGHTSPDLLFPVMEVVAVEEVPGGLEGIPVLHLLTGPHTPPGDEVAHLQSSSQHLNNQPTVEVTLALMPDGTVAVEASLAHALLQWPFLTDLSLILAMTSIFALGAEADADAGEASRNATEQFMRTNGQAPWLYFNFVMTKSQIFVPVLEMASMHDAVQYYFGGGAEKMNMNERLGDILLMAMSLSLDDPGACLHLEERGLALTWSALRFAYSMGGDGETDIRVDLRKLAAFVRDPAACVTCLLLPFSGSAHVSMQAPQAAERAEAERVRRAVVRVQRWWRLHKWQRCAERGRPFRRTDSRTSERGLEGKADLAVEFARRLGQNVSMLRMPSPQQDSMLDDLVEEVATPRTRQLLHKYKQSGAKAQLTTRPMVGPATERAAIKIEMSIKLGACTLRAAFSHIPFLQSAMSLLQRVALHPAPGNIAAPPLPQALPAAPATQLQMNSAFRPTKLSISGTLQSLALVLCNDQPQTFGAPDVLELCTDLVCVQYAMDRHFADRPPDQAFQLQLRSWASFLNNSSSRWEAISEAWSLQAELVDRASPIYRSDHTRSIWLSSEQHLNLYFNPASLLSFGDVLAFWRALTAASPGQTALQPTVSSTSAHSPSFLLTAAQNAPAMEEQLASQASITSRVPQKYLIQNQSGLLVYYWAEEPEVGVARPHSLASGASETLQVVPVQKTLHMMAVGKGGGTEKLGNVINLHFEGNWMPIKDVAVSVVGKYRYHMQSPAEQNNVSVIVDIILVGRTKIITLHSGIWLENHMDRPCSFRLHVPITPLVAPARPGTASREVSNTDTIIGPLASGTGSYLPVSAVLGGLLYAQPEGYCEAVRDVVRLSASIRLLKEQQGYISCEPLGPQEGGPPTPLPLHCCMLVIPAQVNSEFQAYKHIEILAPGELMRAVTPLEATLALHPTLVLTNALPYSMKCIIWQASPFRKLRKVRKEGRHTGLRDFVKYDLRQMHTAFTGTVPITGMANPYYKGEDHELASASGSQHEEVPWRRNSHSLMPASLLPHTSQRLWTPGQHLVVSLEPGQTKDVYAHMAGNLLMHVEVPALGLTASHWSVISWAGGQIARNSISDAKYIYRLPKDLKLRGPPSHSFASHQASLGTTRLRAAAREFRDTLLCTRHLAADTRRMAAQLPSQLSETELVQPDTPLLDRPGDHSSSPTWQTHDNPLAADANAARAGQAAGNAMLMRLVFDAWREASVKRHISTISQVFLPSRRAAANAPPTMHLGIDNSMAGNSSDRSVCKVTLFAPYWIDNRTGIDLIFQDHPSAPSIALLCGANTPWDYAEVLVPGVGLLQRGSSAGLRDLGTAEDPKVDEIPVRPVLLNKQDVTRFALGDVSRKFFSQALSIHTVGLKGTVKIKGPEAVHLALVPDFVRAHLRSSMPSGLRRVEEEARPQPTPVPEAPPAPADGEEEERLVVVLLSPQDDEERVKLHIVMAPELAGERMARSSLTMAEVLSTLSESEGSSSDSERPEQPAASVDDSASGPPRAPPQPSSRRRGQREYQFAVDVSAGPPTSVFRHTKVVTIKSKYIVENLTGMSVEIKQRGMPNNSPDSFAVEGRCSRQLANKDRCAVHWDDVQLPRQLLVRPLGNGGMDMWHWSGGFTLHTKDEYFGVRVRHQLDPARAINIPVSTTVGPSGSVLVTFKSPLSVPPYRIENHCEDVIVFFAQDAVHRDRTKWNWLEPRLGGAAMAYAWDEPNMEHRLRVQACVTGKVGPLQQRSQTYSLDQLGVQASLFLPTVQSRTETGGTLGALESNPAVTEEMKEKLASLLAAEFSRKVYVSVYADGPTRVLRLANSPSVALQETEESILDLAARIKQVEAEVEEVNVRFARLHGLAGGRDLDLYGRAANAGSAATPAPAKPRMRSRLSRGDQLPSHKPLLKLKELAGTPPAGSPLSASGAGASTSFASGAPPQAGPNQPLQRENTFTSGKADTSPLETLARASVEAFTQGESSLSQAGPYATDTDGNPVRMARITDAGHLTALPPASQTVQGTSLIRSAVEADTALLLGGDLIVSVCQADGLRGGNRTTHPFARVEINRQAQQTSVQWQTTAPVWDESLTFRDVSAASELVVDLWDLGGTRGEEALQKLASNPSQVIANSRFLGRVEVPLSETLSLRRGSKRWYTLARRSAHDSVAGRLKLGFAWDVTARSLLTLKLAMLERVLAQRVEILCMLQPVPAQVAADWLLEEATPPRADKAQGATNSQQLPPGQDAAQLSELLLAKHARQEHHANLLVSVLEATGLQPRKGLVVALAASDLPNPVVHFAIAGQQVHEWVRQAERGQHTRVEVDLEGLGVSVMGGLQDELFNLTLDRVSLHGHLTKLEAKMAGSIRRVQLDNQMLDATQPVVLASAPVAHARSETAQALVGGDGNLVSFKVIRSFANSMAALGLEGPGASTPAGNHRARPARMPHSHLVADGKQSPDGQGTIMSFKLIQLYIGETDFQADDGFLEALLSFVVSIPTPDIWQDAAWREQQHRLLTAQFGPKEVESLAMNSVLPLPGLAQDSAAPLRWVQEKELQELTAMRGQSSYSSWYFIEHAQISDINVNVTIALSSSILATRHGSAGLPENRGGLFNRVIGTAGFSLINVNNVPLQLRGWSTTGRLTARRALLASLTRHYLAQAIGEAHKVLGGAGPAIAALPLTVVWAGGSFLSLATNISAGKVGPYGAAKRIGFVLFMSLAQSIGSFSRIGASVMAYLPPPRAGHFSDSGMLTRAVQRPPNAFDAFQRAASELGAGFIAGLAGVLLDPLQGWNSSGLTGAAVGMGKGLLGLPVRPAIGVFEGCSKTAHGLGLVCLGREAISGSVQRRMRAPGAFAEDQQEGSQDSSKQQMQANRQSVIAAWQQALPGAFPKMQDDVVMDVLSTRIGRVLILTDQHLALLRVKVHGSRSIYKAMWTVPMAEIRTVRGLEERLLMIVEHVHSYKIPLMGMWAVPSRKSVRCDSRATFEKIIMKVNRHIRQGTMHSQAGGFNNSFAGDSYADLSMVTRPAS
ncbi:hypothetical protein WJX72_009012 [[Myrmecia] bisecta]|uniref:C2 domain-containing protein n=1 Tax=[Myrmecia] bisecta TaxID=41462 RepID=A0AAW1Q1E8_9CHLO